jgi:ankyrin repeat protein
MSTDEDYARQQTAVNLIHAEIRAEIREKLEKGEVNSRVRETGHTLLTWSFWNDRSLFEQLLKAGADPEIASDHYLLGQFTALMLAAKRYDKDALRLLLKAGAKINTQNDSGLTALTCALNQLRFDERYLSIKFLKKGYACVEFLLNNNADLSLKATLFGEEKDAIDLMCEMRSLKISSLFKYYQKNMWSNISKQP